MVVGLLALECAMDELADALRLDPVELRLRNDTQVDPAPLRRHIERSGAIVTTPILFGLHHCYARI
jgi:CO/xanthine dehydrogenase Mo-binding subunit